MPCHERNGEITGYNITYYPNIYGDAAQRSINVSGITVTNRTFVAHGLLPRTSYIFEVRAINSRGVGPATKERFNTTVPEGKSTVVSYIIMYVDDSYIFQKLDSF